MARWFANLPIHQKLVTMALLVTASALIVATVGLALVDLYRYREQAIDEARSTAAVIAENSAAAVTFGDVEAAQKNLDTARVLPFIQRACLYLPDGTLFAGYARTEEFRCLSARPKEPAGSMVAATAAIVNRERTVGSVYVERDLTDMWRRVALTGLSGFIVLVLATAVALVLADTLHRRVSTPIAQLASAARAMGVAGTNQPLPDVQTNQDEIGQLVTAFRDMLGRVQDATSRLVASNERLRQQEIALEDLLVREREASRLKDEFLAAVSHELRTPLNAITGWVQILETTNPNEETRTKALASMARNAQAQARVIDDLVDVSRIVSGKLHLQFGVVDLGEVIDHAIEVVRLAASAKQIRLTVRRPDSPCLVNGDRDRLQQIVWNLLSNAVKFTPQRGSVAVELSADPAGCEVSVTDTGLGMAASFVPHVFDRFRQADGSTTRQHSGLGLGLAIVKELTELHGGIATAESHGLGLGSRFSVRVPSYVGPAPAAAPVVPRDTSADEALRGVRVLAVDDNQDALDVLLAALTKRGADLRVCTSGAEAVREWAGWRPDVLVCDLAMPRLDGIGLLRTLRQNANGQGRMVPAIALTAQVTSDVEANTRAAGFDAYLAKPYDIGALVGTIVAVLNRS